MNDLSRRKFLSLTAQGVIISAFLPSALQAAMSNKPAVVAVMKNWNRFQSDPNAYISQMKLFTDTYKKYSKVSTSAREIECLKIQYPMYFCDIQENDLFAGRERKPLIGFMAQGTASFGYYYDDIALRKFLDDPKISQENKAIVADLISFWKNENSNQQCRDAFPSKMKAVLNSEGWQTEPLIASPLYRMSGTQCDFDKLIRLGIPGLRKEIESYKSKTTKGGESYSVYEGMEKALNLFGEVANYYADMAVIQAKTALPDRKKELLIMEKVLRKIATQKPETLREAIQLMFLYADITGTINYGRMDEYLGDIYASELKQGSLTKPEAIRLMSNLWNVIDAKGNVWDSRVIVGGKGRRNEKNADQFALLAMEVTEKVRSITPQFTLRFYKDQNPALYKKALDVIGTGNPYPMIYNDEVNIPSVMNAFKIPYEEAIHYLPFGCGEYILYHRSVGTPSGVINLLQALSVTIHKGINPVSKKPVGVGASELGTFDTFDKLFSAYKKNVELYVEQLAYQERLEYEIAGKVAPFLFLSMVFDDCIKRGKGIFSGGVRYLGGTLESYGNTNTADSLVAIKKLVYEDKKLTLDKIVAALDANFEGYGKERRMMLDVAKYGNDENYADDIKVEVDRHICTVTRNMSDKAGLDSYLVVIINNSANTTMGQQTAATPDGRKSFSYMANANAPVGGADKNGVTAFLNSIVKPDTKIHAGAVQNMKFSKDMFSTYRPKTEALLKTYWEKGGAQCMINCLGRDDLENAMKYPEKYASLIVRVGGFCARFVELPKEVQLEILSRTLY
ncbi:MAG TPA: pyruvate formate lyase family protein [Prolixibacteraceae bacterium]|nr:pyruvate formate lyase family protein [Prolixibacteraceae bacterium]